MPHTHAQCVRLRHGQATRTKLQGHDLQHILDIVKNFELLCIDFQPSINLFICFRYMHHCMLIFHHVINQKDINDHWHCAISCSCTLNNNNS